MTSMLLGDKSMSFILIWELVGITLLLTFYHYLIFGELILNSASTKRKVLIHFILSYVTLFVFCMFLKWVSITNLNSILIFTGSYTFLYLSCIFSFYVYYKSTGEELNDKLTAYKEKKNINKGE
jgi:hypothetical protein